MATWAVRQETADDREAIRSVTVAAFGRDDEANLVAALRADEAWIEELSMVAVDTADRVVGHALMTRCRIGDVSALALAPCSVLPEYQRSGVGGAVIAELLRVARMRGERAVVVLGHPEYYPRFGFRNATLSGIHLSIDVPDGALMVLPLATDRGLPSGMIRYAEPFGV